MKQIYSHNKEVKTKMKLLEYDIKEKNLYLSSLQKIFIIDKEIQV